MASYHCSVKVGGKGKASGHAAYIAREGRYAQYDGYEDLEATGYGNMPAWAEGEPALFWTAADRHERANGTTYREIEIALPRELDPAQRQALVLGFIRQEIGEWHAHQWAIHNPAAALAGGEQPHAHLMYSERTLDGIDRDPEQYFKRHNGKHPELGGCRKDSAGTEERLLETRQRWAEVQNAHLQQHGHAARVDHRSLADQGIDRAPEQHLGGRRVRQLEPEQREALLERREAEQELTQAEQGLSAIPMASHIQALEARAQEREQAQQQAFMAEVREYCQQAYRELQTELAQQAEQERAQRAEREREQEREREAEHARQARRAPEAEQQPEVLPNSDEFQARHEARMQAMREWFAQFQAQHPPEPQAQPQPRGPAQDWGLE